MKSTLKDRMQSGDIKITRPKPATKPKKMKPKK